MVPTYMKAWFGGPKNPTWTMCGLEWLLCTWLRQSILLFILPCLDRSSKNNFTILAQDVNPCAQKASSFWKSTPIHTSSNSNYTSLIVSKMQTTFQLQYWISMPLCITYWCSNSCLVFNSACWSCSIFCEWNENAFCWHVNYFPCYKVWIITFYYSNYFHNSRASHSTFLAYDSILCKCPHNFATCSLTNSALASNSTTHVWCRHLHHKHPRGNNGNWYIT